MTGIALIESSARSRPPHRFTVVDTSRTQPGKSFVNWAVLKRRTCHPRCSRKVIAIVVVGGPLRIAVPAVAVALEVDVSLGASYFADVPLSADRCSKSNENASRGLLYFSMESGISFIRRATSNGDSSRSCKKNLE